MRSGHSHMNRYATRTNTHPSQDAHKARPTIGEFSRRHTIQICFVSEACFKKCRCSNNNNNNKTIRNVLIDPHSQQLQCTGDHRADLAHAISPLSEYKRHAAARTEKRWRDAARSEVHVTHRLLCRPFQNAPFAAVRISP